MTDRIVCPETNMLAKKAYSEMNSTGIRDDTWEPEKFDGLRRKLIPSFNLLYESAADVVEMTLSGRAMPKILDLGAGTGLLSAAIHRKVPRAELILLDISESMLKKARSRFNGSENVRLVVGNLADPLPEGKFDAIISGLAIHHLTHERKIDLFQRICRSLSSGGLFVNVEQVLAPCPELEKMYDIRHEKHVHAAETPAEEWAAGRERMKLDICADTDTQLDWLRQVGFSTVDCLAKDWRFATYAAWA